VVLPALSPYHLSEGHKHQIKKIQA